MVTTPTVIEEFQDMDWHGVFAGARYRGPGMFLLSAVT
jgi:hypothetical protein